MLMRFIANEFRRLIAGPQGPPNTAEPPNTAASSEYAGNMARAAAQLRGDHYLSVLDRIHDERRPKRYLEIGTFTGESLRLAQPETMAIGVDPEPAIAEPLGAHIRVFEETSDSFFASRDVRAEFGGALDMVFIDGMHLFEFALRDFMNAERLCARDAVILLHDAYPLDKITATRERHTVFWSGDIWRAVLALKKYRPDLKIATLAAPPTGLCVVTGIDPDSTVLERRMDEIVAEFMSVDYGYLDGAKAQLLSLVPVPPAADRLVPA